MTIKVTLHIYSGRPDPTWELSDEQAREFIERVGKIEKRVPAESLERYGGLGYSGFTIDSVGEKALGEKVGIYKGSINLAHSDFNLSDDNLELEQWILSTADKNLSEDIKVYVNQELLNKKKLIYPEELATKIAPAYNPEKWNSNPTTCKCNNCYNYANDKITNDFAQPGLGSGQCWTDLNCSEVTTAAQRDGQISVSSFSSNPDNGHFIALVSWPDNDYHWFRLDNNNYWSHKPGRSPARDWDESKNSIKDPRTCNRGPYTDFCGFFKCIPANTSIKGYGCPK